QWQIYYEATKLVPVRACTLKTIFVAFINYDITATRSKSCKYYVWTDHNGQPDSVLFSHNFDISLEADDAAWVSLDVSAADITLEGPFWVGHHEPTAGPPTSLSDTVATPGANFYSEDSSSWTEDDYDYLQMALVNYAEGENVINETEPNNKPEKAQRLLPPSPVTVIGNAEVSDDGEINIPLREDDIEDLFVVTTQFTGINITLTEISSDLDLFLLKIVGNSRTFYGSNNRGSAHDEEFNKTDLEPGTYFIGVSIYDPEPIGSSSSYVLTVTGDIISSVKDISLELPKQFALEQNYPNPFNPETTISYNLPKQTHVTLNIYNIVGEKVITLCDTKKNAGYHSVRWNGRDSLGRYVSGGIYLCKMEAGTYSKTIRMLLLK
ncbi:MAG: T9SS type A sorting domain-containing protein, partial [Methanomassiliicoccales archaeon]